MAVTSVPHPIGEEIRDVKEGQERLRPGILGWIVVRKVNRTVAVAERHTSKVPEDQHEAPFLVVHVPGGDDHLLALRASIRIEKMCHEQKADFASHVTVLLPLPSRCAEADEEENVPWQSDLEEHLEVQPAEHTRVKLRAHEEIIDGIARHSVLSATIQSAEVCDDTNDEAADYRNAHERSKLVDKSVQLEQATEMQSDGDDDRKIEAIDTIAVIAQLFAACVR